jgi:hypothetical protein
MSIQSRTDINYTRIELKPILNYLPNGRHESILIDKYVFKIDGKTIFCDVIKFNSKTLPDCNISNIAIIFQKNQLMAFSPWGEFECLDNTIYHLGMGRFYPVCIGSSIARRKLFYESNEISFVCFVFVF